MWETWVQSLGWEDPLEKGKATTHSSILAWRIPWTVQSYEVAKSQTRLSDFHFTTSLPSTVKWVFLRLDWLWRKQLTAYNLERKASWRITVQSSEIGKSRHRVTWGVTSWMPGPGNLRRGLGARLSGEVKTVWPSKSKQMSVMGTHCPDQRIGSEHCFGACF